MTVNFQCGLLVSPGRDPLLLSTPAGDNNQQLPVPAVPAGNPAAAPDAATRQAGPGGGAEEEPGEAEQGQGEENHRPHQELPVRAGEAAGEAGGDQEGGGEAGEEGEQAGGAERCQSDQDQEEEVHCREGGEREHTSEELQVRYERHTATVQPVTEVFYHQVAESESQGALTTCGLPGPRSQ